jgi:hypothetical protein
MRYSDDLRRKLIEAWESNGDPRQDLADQFGVSLGGGRRCSGVGTIPATVRPRSSGPVRGLRSRPLAGKSLSSHTPMPPWPNSAAA